MKFVVAIALAAVFLATNAAADEVVQVNSVPNGAIVYSSPAVINSGQVVRSTRYGAVQRTNGRQQGVFGRWMEFERRKNAWMRQRLLGR